jgi:hypothetical protein
MLKIDISIEFESADDFQIQSLTAVKLKSNKSSITWNILKIFVLPFYSKFTSIMPLVLLVSCTTDSKRKSTEAVFLWSPEIDSKELIPPAYVA